jgi:ABC-type transporter Mla MlaB component
MWMIQIMDNGGVVVFRLSGCLEREQLAELQRVFDSQKRLGRIVLDLSGIRTVDRESVALLAGYERDGAQLENCPPYIREWIAKENQALIEGYK